MTHLICGVGKSGGDSGGVGPLAQARTIKYLMAVAANNALVTKGWLDEWQRNVVEAAAAAAAAAGGEEEKVLLSSQPVPPPPAADFSIAGVWRQGTVHALLAGDRGKIFDGVSFFFSESYDRDADTVMPRAPKRRELQELIVLGGGKVFDTREKAEAAAVEDATAAAASTLANVGEHHNQQQEDQQQKQQQQQQQQQQQWRRLRAEAVGSCLMLCARKLTRKVAAGLRIDFSFKGGDDGENKRTENDMGNNGGAAGAAAAAAAAASKVSPFIPVFSQWVLVSSNHLSSALLCSALLSSSLL